MALGGGSFTGSSKTLPGAYVNFISLAKSSGLFSKRGAAAFAFELDWGALDEIFIVSSEEFIKNSAKIFGYDCAHEKTRGLRELFRNASEVYAFRLGSGGVKASCAYGEARYIGIRGNDLCVAVSADSESDGLFSVKTLLSGKEVDLQIVSASSELKDNDFVVWDKGSELSAALANFTGGENPNVDFDDERRFLEKLESYSVNAVGIVSEDARVNALLASYAVNMRDKVGVKLQCVAFNYNADYEGVVNVKNPVISSGENAASLVYWVTGLIAGRAVNRSCLNAVYDGEYEVFADYSQKELEASIKNGEFTLHKVDGALRVLADVNSLVTISDEKGEAFKDNQTIRVIDQIAGDIGALFNSKYLGNVANDESGRISLWADIVKHHETLARIRAIENFSDDDVEVLAGDDKRSVVVKDRINVVNAMAQVYMTCMIC